MTEPLPTLTETGFYARRSVPHGTLEQVRYTNGAGKEKIAEIIQAGSRRAQKPFRAKVDVDLASADLKTQRIFSDAGFHFRTSCPPSHGVGCGGTRRPG